MGIFGNGYIDECTRRQSVEAAFDKGCGLSLEKVRGHRSQHDPQWRHRDENRQNRLQASPVGAGSLYADHQGKGSRTPVEQDA